MNEDLRKTEADLNRSVAEAAGEPAAEVPAAPDKPPASEARGVSQ